jgi:hypothetical protein
MSQGATPEPILLAKTPTSAVHVQDLAVVLPLYLLTAAWLWRRHAWGFVLAPILLILADVMLVALLAMGDSWLKRALQAHSTWPQSLRFWRC